VPLQNRVTPFGDIVATPARGTFMGNRGILHNDQRLVHRDWQVRRWIACRLDFRGRHRTVMQPGSYTELFFLDEAVALADGHRPCAECRHADYRAFQTAWRTVYPDQSATADAMDAILHTERRIRPFLKRTHLAEIGSLPDGTFVAMEGRAWLLGGDWMRAWSADGYTDCIRRPSAGVMTVLTPPSVVKVLRVGYRPHVKSSSILE
jgi:hypothetical protein